LLGKGQGVSYTPPSSHWLVWAGKTENIPDGHVEIGRRASGKGEAIFDPVLTGGITDSASNSRPTPAPTGKNGYTKKEKGGEVS